MKFDKGSLIRTILLLIALVNQVLTAFGLSPLPLEDELVETAISTIFTIVVSLWTWWKNNYISSKGLKQKEVLKQHNLTK